MRGELPPGKGRSWSFFPGVRISPEIPARVSRSRLAGPGRPSPGGSRDGGARRAAAPLVAGRAGRERRRVVACSLALGYTRHTRHVTMSTHDAAFIPHALPNMLLLVLGENWGIDKGLVAKGVLNFGALLCGDLDRPIPFGSPPPTNS